jgi:hypothetical protein
MKIGDRSLVPGDAFEFAIYQTYTPQTIQAAFAQRPEGDGGAQLTTNGSA